MATGGIPIAPLANLAAERGLVIVTSNESFERWADGFPDATIGTAVLDRLVQYAHLAPIVGDSYRMNELRACDPKRSDPRKKKPA